MRRVLIVSPHFPPSSTADMHRVRLLLPYLRENGWEAEVLAVEPEQVGGPVDPWLAEGLPSWVPIHRVAALGLGWSFVPGLGTLGWRAFHALGQEGYRVLARRRFDLIYFSTTVFEVFGLGPRWARMFGVPFVLDYQDPWVNDYYSDHPDVTPPGGRLKYAVVDSIHRWMEAKVLHASAGITSVSPRYTEQLGKRYPQLSVPTLVQPFPAPTYDLNRVGTSGVRQAKFDRGDGLIHWVYVGVLVPSMIHPLRALFRALRGVSNSGLMKKLRIHFIGTSYAASGRVRPEVLRTAEDFGLEDLVDEVVDRIPYSEALACMRDADALLAIGSDDRGYTPSKIFPYLLSGRPLLALYRNDSPVIPLLEACGGSVCVSIDPSESETALAARIADDWLADEQFARSLDMNPRALIEFSERSSAAALGQFFDRCLSP